MTVRLARPAELDEAIAQIGQADRVAIDTEFHAEGRYIPRLFLVQVHLPDGTTWLFDAAGDGGIRKLGPALCDRPWVLHAGQQDLRILREWFGRLPDRVVDTQIGAGLLAERYPEGYDSLVARYLGRTIEKGQRLSDWSKRPLRPEQIAYAAADVQLLFDLWDRIAAALADVGRAGVAAAACMRALEDAGHTPDPADAWRGITAVPGMDDAALRVLRALAAWRRRRAQDLDSPERSVVGDGLLVQLARRQPRTRGELTANRRMPKSVVRRHGDAITSVVAEALGAEAPPAPPVVRYRTPEWRRLAWLECYAQCLGAEHRWAARLVLPRHLLHDLVVEPPTDRSDLATRLGWRDALAGDALWRALEGGVCLSLGGDIRVEDRPPGALGGNFPSNEV